MITPSVLPGAGRLGEALARAEERLRAGDPSGALKALDASGLHDPLIENARGVCLMRLGRVEAATDLYRDLLLADGALEVGDDTPPTLVANFATAMILGNNLCGALSLMQELDADRHPSVRRLRDALEVHRRGLGWWGRLNFDLYGESKLPVALDGPPGELLHPVQVV